MTFEVDEEILQDFLVEAGEILELLSEQLVELENNPNDTELLNAIFRGFHTVKGGAGFLSLTELVETCHGAENVFDGLRQGNRQVDSELMDTILGALDIINDQFSAVQNGEQMEKASASLLDALHRLSKAAATTEVEQVAVASPEAIIEPILTTSDNISDIDEFEFDALLDELHTQSGSNVEAQPVKKENADITEDEFENLLDELHSKPNTNNEAPKQDAGDDSDISDDEFESLLDELHGVGKHSLSAAAPAATVESDSDEISDDEFENLLDELHGKGAHGGIAAIDKDASDEISDDEFESLLDELHGSVKSTATESIPPETIQSTVKATPQTPIAKSEPLKSEAVKPTIAKEKAVAAKAPANKVAQAEPTVRVDTSTLDEIMNMVGELVLVRNRLVSLESTSDNEEMSRAIANLAIVTGDLQGSVMKTRMQPIKKVFGKFPRVVRDLARQLGKNIHLELVGEETDLDKNLVEALADPLVHLVRNSVDHGIEMPDVRMQSGKETQGRILLSAAQEGDHILLVIEDDGAGMDAERLKQIAINKGILDQDGADRMTDKEAYSLIFAPGFSTKAEISDISGRGVGMDVVKTSISRLNGTISIDSAIGKGTRLEIKVPLTLAILPTLMIVIAEQTFALPLTNVNEIFHLDLAKTNVVNGQLTIVIRDRAIPLFYLRDWLAPKAPRAEKGKGLGHVVIVQLGTQLVAFVVDGLLGQEEVVIKALDKLLSGTPGMAGATITSDGGIALILDLPSLLKHYT
ncbi:chemotaxis protein CheA [Psychromonas sp. SR45-3]|uniref:chemotaxis protein CheA n=1 Tax=Psychromonas sp. SR45-3 TaxID=2760930 RepID=UPI0015FDE3EE|nr:chemotaxis protein CheA [Psychromonas sp. SR45-3]MBB1271669.1 chemotaxis protein CheA [Psychromonas sp. SR45-3]